MNELSERRDARPGRRARVSMRRIARAALVVISLLAGSCRRRPALDHGGLRWPQDVGEVTVAATTADGLLTVPVRINGREAGRWVVDTAALGNGATEALVDEFGLPLADADVGGRLEISGPQGRGPMSLCWVDTLSVGTLSLGRHPVYRLPNMFSRPGLEGITGVLGQEWLRLSAVTLDYGAASVSFRAPASFRAPDDAEEVPVSAWHMFPLVTGVLPDGTALRLLLDTGSTNSLTLVPDFRDRLSLDAGSVERVSVLGAWTQQTGKLAAIDVLGRRFENVTVGVAPRSDVVTLEGCDGLIGSGLLSGLEVTIDARNWRMWVRESPARR